MEQKMPGILILEDNKTYGRTDNGKRLFYRCVPDNKELQTFLVPYDLRLGFSKDLKNKYVLFKFDKWEGKHPRGIIIETIGDVSNLDCYYEYQLHRRCVCDSISNFSNRALRLFGNIEDAKLIAQIMAVDEYKIQDRLGAHVITVDPVGSQDIDDGFSVLENPETGIFTVSIYISNVYVWLNTFGLLNEVCRVSTIYLPNRRIPMLPNILSDNLCSLLEKKERIAFCMDVDIRSDGVVIREPRFTNVLIKVRKNYSYESDDLLSSTHYKKMSQITKKINSRVNDSHDLIEHWMIFMNTKCGALLAKQDVGIFRTALFKETRESKFDNPNTEMFFRNWNNVDSNYSTASSAHEILDIESYAQITSPIRRSVDLINQTAFMKLIGISNSTSDEFLSLWYSRIDILNSKMKSIRIIQNDCAIMKICYNAIDQSDDGVIFDGEVKDDIYKYKVYLENLRLISSIKSYIRLDNYSKHNFRIFLFTDESDKNRKIRLDIM